MSHNYPYRQPPSNADLRPDPGPYSSSDCRHTSSDHNFYRAPQDSSSSSHLSSSSSRGAQWSQDGALSILSSCGLEPEDLALLAELPEDVLTVESLPHVLKQIKGKRGTIRPFPPTVLSSFSSSSSSSFPPSSARRPTISPSTSDWDHRSQSVQYPLGHVTPSPLSFDQDLDRWGNPRTSSAVRADPPSSSSSSSYMVDFNHRPGPSDYGKTGRDAGSVSSLDRPSFSSAERGKRNHSSRFCQPGPADHRSAPPPEEYHHHRESETSSIRSSSRPAASMPSNKEAKDFHGTSPPVFPYSCSLCDITVMSEKVWIKHINGTQHADGQLSLLQQFPNWDCRMETVSRADSQSEKWKDEGTPGRQPQTANQNSKSQPNKKPQKKTSEKGKVVCVKFPAQSVDETYLRKLTEPFGKIVKILMFPSLAFVELGSIDQAKDLVKFHVNYPPTVNGEQMEFRISNTFTFLQSSRVVSFSPAPTGENGQSDLFSIIKRFGPPLYTLFLPSMAFVEMKNTPDAQKMVDYYSSNTLRINNDVIKVSFSGEYKSLMRVASAKRYEEESCSTKRTRSSSRDKEDKTTETKRRRSSKDREEEEEEEEEEGQKSSRDRRTRTRSESREKSTKEKTTTTRSRSREKSTKEKTVRTRSRSREKSTKEKIARSRSKSREKSSREKTARTRSESREKSTKENTSRTRSRSRDKSSSDGRTRTRPKSREKSTKEKTTRSRSKDKSSSDRKTRTRSRSREKSTKEKTARSRSRDKSSSDGRTKTRSKSREKSSREKRSRSKSRSREKSVVPERMETTDSQSRTDPGPAPVRDSRPEAEEKEQTEEEAESSAEESDIEGMEVIGEDGESLEDEDVEEDKLEEAAEKDNCPAERTDSPEEDKEKEVKGGEADHQQQQENVTEEKKVEKEKPINEKEGEEEVCGMKKQEEESESNREAEETAETQLEDDEEEPDFPVDLENCITLDELEEDQSDDQDEVRDERECLSTRVVYFRNLPLHSYTDTEFVNLVKEFGTAVHFFSVRRRQKGFIEMSTSSEALRAVQEMTCKPVTFKGSKLIVQISNKYKRLINGSAVQSAKDSDEEKRSERRRSERLNGDESNTNSERRKESLQKTPEKESVSKTANKEESVSRNSPEKEVLEQKTPEKESYKSHEKDTKNTSEKTSRTTPENESANKKTSEKESKQTEEKDSAETESAAKKTPEKELLLKTSQENKTLKRKGTRDNDSVPEKKSSDETQRNQELEAAEAPEEQKLEINEKEQSEEETSEPGRKDSEKSRDQPDSTGDPPKSQQKPADRLQDSEVQVEQLSRPAGGAAKLQKPPKPVGTEFVRPVVGYFCNLCQLIYADEDEAKVQHCSSQTHYRKYQEKTGKDPWVS